MLASLDQRELASVNTPMQIEQTRVGVIHLRAELKTLRERGLIHERGVDLENWFSW